MCRTEEDLEIDAVVHCIVGVLEGNLPTKEITLSYTCVRGTVVTPQIMNK